MSSKPVWINILCDSEQRPFKVIVTDGANTHEIPCSNSNLERTKRSLRQIYNVKELYVSVILDDTEET